MKNAILLFSLLLFAVGGTAAPAQTLPAHKVSKRKVVKKKVRAKARHRIHKQTDVVEVDAPPGRARVLPALGTKDRTTKSFQRATTPSAGGVVMRTMSKSEYAEYAAVADREAEAAERVQRKKVAPPLPVEKLVIDDLEKQILAETTESDAVSAKPKDDIREAPSTVTETRVVKPEPPVDEIPVPDDAVLIGAYEMPAVSSTQLETPSVQQEIEAELGLDPVETEALESIE